MKQGLMRFLWLALLTTPTAWAELFAENGCIGCHDVVKKKMGPTWSEIAEKREGSRSEIINAIRYGSKGVYGKIPMPPQPKSIHNAEAIADAILALREDSPAWHKGAPTSNPIRNNFKMGTGKPPRLVSGVPMFNPVWVPPGELILRVHVLANGQPDQVLIKESSGSQILDDEAVNQIKTARFHPGERNGQITDYWVDLPITYKKPNPFGFGASNTATNLTADSSGKQLPQTKSYDTTPVRPTPTYIPLADTTPPHFAFYPDMHITLTEGAFTLTGHVGDDSRIAEIQVDGKPIAFEKNGAFSVKRFFSVGETVLNFAATDVHGNTANAIVTVVRQAAATQAVAANEPALMPPEAKLKANRQSFALIVGIEDYGNTFKAQHAVRDANLFYDYAQRSLGIPAENIKLLTGEKATRAHLLHTVKNWLAPNLTRGKSQVVVFFAGHGLASQNGEKAFLIPHDALPDMLDETAIDRQQLMANIARAEPQSALFFFDTCYSGGARGGDKTLVANARAITIKPRADLLPPGFMQFSAAGNDQFAHSHPSQPHGLFSYYLMRGLGGEADANHDNRLTAGELHAFVRERVQHLSQGRPQVPELIGDPERVIAVWKQ